MLNFEWEGWKGEGELGGGGGLWWLNDRMNGSVWSGGGEELSGVSFLFNYISYRTRR